jgi:hypothetical protein
LHLADSAQTWLEHLPASQIHNRDDLVRTFVGNFQGMYVHPGNSSDLRACTQKPGESLRDFIRRFSKRCMELSSVAQSEIVHAFLEGMTCRDLVRELGRGPPVDSNELFDIATSFASGEEAMRVIFDGKKGKHVDDAPAEGSGCKEPQQKHKRGKKGKKLRREAHAPGRDNDRDEALAVDPARRGPRAAPRGPIVFDDMLKKPCPYHKTPVNHTLEQCDLLKRYYSRAAAKDDDAKKDGGDGDAGGFLAVENVFLIFGGGDRGHVQQPAQAGAARGPRRREGSSLLPRLVGGRHHLQPRRSPEPHTQSGPVPAGGRPSHRERPVLQGADGRRQQPNILYAHTLRLLGIGLDQLRPSTTPFHGVTPGKRVQPLRQIDLPVWFGTLDNFRKETLTF